MTTQTKLPKIFTLPLRPEEAEKSQEIKNKIDFYKSKFGLQDNRKYSLFEALVKIIEIVEKQESQSK